jgi:heme exporter protein A
MALIETEGLTKTFGLLPALQRLDLQIERGECVALLGPNGGGKSTLLRLLCGLSKPSAGIIRVGGWALPGEAAAVRAQIGVVAHKPLLYDTLTAAENLRFFGRLYGVPAGDADARIRTLLAEVGLAKRADDLVRTFSRGMLQRLSIARALLHQPDVLLFDEPHTGLDQAASAMLDAVIVRAREQGRTLVIATHEMERAAQLTTRAVILMRGRVAHDGPLHGMDGAALSALYAGVTR